MNVSGGGGSLSFECERTLAVRIMEQSAALSAEAQALLDCANRRAADEGKVEDILVDMADAFAVTASGSTVAAETWDALLYRVQVAQFCVDPTGTTSIMLHMAAEAIAMAQACSQSGCETGLVDMLGTVYGYLNAYVNDDRAVLGPLFRKEGFEVAVKQIDDVAQQCAAEGNEAHNSAVELASKAVSVAQKAHLTRRSLEEKVEALKRQLEQKIGAQQQTSISVGLHVVTELDAFYIRYVLMFGVPPCGIYDPTDYSTVKRLIEEETAAGPEAVQAGMQAALKMAEDRRKAEAAAREAEKAAEEEGDEGA